MVAEYLNAVRSRLDDDEFLASIIQSGKKTEEFGPESQAGTLDFTKERVNQILYLLMSGSSNTAKKIADGMEDVDRDDFESVCRLAFDLAEQLDDTDAMIGIANSVSLDQGRTVRAVMPAAAELIEKKEYENAKALIAKYRDSLSPEALSEHGLRQLEISLDIDTDSDDLDFSESARVSDVYQLEKYLVTQVIDTVYDQLLAGKKFKSAAALAQAFDFSAARVKTAAVKAFDERFEAFTKILEKSGRNPEKVLDEPGPYQDVLRTMEMFQLLDSKDGTTESKKYMKHVKERAYSILKRLTHHFDKGKVDLILEAGYCAHLTKDFQLTDLKDPQMAEQCGTIINKVVSQIDEKMLKLGDVNDYFKPLALLLDTYTGYKSKIKRIGSRTFEIYLQNNQYGAAKDAADTFEVDGETVYSEVRSKILGIITQTEPEEIKKIIDYFGYTHRLSKDKLFNDAVNEAFEVAVQRHSFQNAKLLCDEYNIPAKRRVAALRKHLKSLLMKLQDQDVKDLITMFQLRYNDLRRIFIDIYKVRLRMDIDLAVKFREDFALSILDVGLMHWLFNEFFGGFFQMKKPSSMSKVPPREPSDTPAE